MGKTAGPRHILSPRLKKGAQDRAAEKSGITPTMYLEVDGGVFLRLESTLTASSGPPQGVGRGGEIGEKRKRKNERKEGRERNEKRQGERRRLVTAFSYIFLLALLSVRRVERGTLPCSIADAADVAVCGRCSPTHTTHTNRG